MDRQLRNTSLLALIVTLSLFVAGRFLGIGPLDNVWSFSHWKYSPSWYPFAWVVALAALGLVFVWIVKPSVVSRRASLAILLLVPLSLVVCWFARYQVLAWGGGNLRIAQLAQVEVIVVRWFEFGAVLAVKLLFGFYRLLDVPVLYAAGQAWRALALISAGVAGLGAYWLATMLADTVGRRLLVFLIVFFGGHALLYFGFVGVEVVIAPVVIWFAVMVIAVSKKPSGRNVAGLWAVLIVGIVFLSTLVFLIPAAVYITSAARQRRKQPSSKPILWAALAFVILEVLVYWHAGHSLEFARDVLFLQGKLPFSTYGLFSLEHLSDWLQTLFLGAPLIVAAVVITWTARYAGSQRLQLVTLSWMVAGGVIAIFIQDPKFGAPLDFLRFVGYLSPIAVLLAVLLVSPDGETRSGISLAIAAALAVMLPVAVIIPYRYLAPAESYTKNFLEAHEPYYQTACLAFRDSYSYRRNWSEAERWEKLLPVQSSDYMNLRGTDYLAQRGEYEEAVKIQYRIIAKQPYWSDPRALVAANQMKLGRYALAKAQIDTCLMLEPYRLEYWINLYSYFRDIQNYPDAKRALARAEELAPHNADVLTDKMIISYRAQDFAAADALANSLIASDSLLPFPYLIKAFLADKDRESQTALQLYQKFVKLGPKEPEVERVKSRIDTLKAALNDL